MNRRSGLVAVLVFLVASLAQAAGPQIDLGKFVQETQFSEPANGGFRLIWWIPTEYWRQSFKNAAMTDQQKDAFIKAVDDYIVVAVIDGQLNPLGNSKWRSADQIRKDLTIKIGQSDPMAPLKDADVATKTQALLAMMKPMFRKMLGEVGTGTELICFQGKDAKQANLLDPRAPGFFRVTYAGKDYNWRLPLGSLLPPKIDAHTGEKFPGNYRFNPFTGAKLSAFHDAPGNDSTSTAH